jgi:hypothetical protein
VDEIIPPLFAMVALAGVGALFYFYLTALGVIF